MKKWLKRIILEVFHQYRTEREFRQVRQQLILFAQAKGIYTDEDAIRVLE